MKHILVVDDPAIGHMLSLILHRDGFRVLQVTSGEAAIVALRARHFDVVLAEASLASRGGGLGLCAYVRREWPRAKVILSTRTASLEPGVAHAYGAHDVLLKPYRLADLRQAIGARAHTAVRRVTTRSPARAPSMARPEGPARPV